MFKEEEWPIGASCDTMNSGVLAGEQQPHPVCVNFTAAEGVCWLACHACVGAPLCISCLARTVRMDPLLSAMQFMVPSLPSSQQSSDSLSLASVSWIAIVLWCSLVPQVRSQQVTPVSPSQQWPATPGSPPTKSQVWMQKCSWETYQTWKTAS